MAKFKSYLYECESQLKALLSDAKNLDHCASITIEAKDKYEAIQDTLSLMEDDASYDDYKIYATIEVR